jgi:predicted metallopeptidase
MTSRKKTLDYAGAMRRLVEDVVRKVPEFGHIRLDAVAFTVSHSRVEGHGQFAKIVPLRFEGGSDVRMYRRRRYRIPPVTVEGNEILYVISFCMPKFQNMAFEAKLLTVLHELYHISPEFNGDIRRFPGRNYAHGSSRKAFNAQVQALVDRYLAADLDPEALALLTPTMAELLEAHGRVTAPRIPIPKLIPLDPVKKKRAA